MNNGLRADDLVDIAKEEPDPGVSRTPTQASAATSAKCVRPAAAPESSIHMRFLGAEAYSRSEQKSRTGVAIFQRSASAASLVGEHGRTSLVRASSSPM